MNIRPIGGHLVIKPIEANETTAAGIILPETSKERPEQGEVLAVGPGKMLDSGQRQAPEVQVGQRVMFKKYAPDEFKVDGQTVYVIDSSDVIAIIE